MFGFDDEAQATPIELKELFKPVTNCNNLLWGRNVTVVATRTAQVRTN